MKAIGLDVGHSAVKLAYSRGALPETALIPTAVVPAFTIYDDGAAKRAARETVQVGGRSYFVGETAIAQGGMRTTPGLFEDWVQTSQHDALLLAGQRLAIESGADEEALIVLGLPAGLYARQRDALRERASRLLGSEVMVMSQPFGPFSLHMIDERGVLRSAHALESESWAVIEVGYYTTDFTLLRNGLWIEDKTASCSGVSRATDRLRKALSVSGVSSTLMECEEILRTRKMRNFGDMVTLPIKVVNWKLVPKDGAKEQIKKIAALLKSATVVINAGDPDREGQLLVDEVLEHLGWRGPTQRLMLNATDPASVKKALAKIEDNAKYHPVRDAAACRQGADWLIGMNMSRAVTKMLSDGALVSIGRVQTPTLALIVRRQREIDAFRSETFYKLRATFKTDAGAAIDLMAEPQPRVLDIKIAQALAAAVKSKRTSLTVETAATVRRAPLPYELSSFQKDAEAAFGWTAAQSLANLQASYEAKLTR